MHFRLRQDVENWFQHIKDTKPMKTMFDRYYLCFMLGIASNSSSTPEEKSNNVSDFVDYFVTEYRPYQRLIIGLLVRAELAKAGIDIKEKQEVSDFLVDYIDPNSPTNLSDLGIKKMNEYASGGFDYLTQSIATQPYTIEEFLGLYVKLIKTAVENNEFWGNKNSTGTIGSA